jgi:hypothetical protein
MKLKLIARTLLIASLSTTTMAAFAATTPDYPVSSEDQVPLSEEFPNIDTYKKQHGASAISQTPMTYPAQALQEYPLSGEFPNMQTYEDLHMNTPVARSNTSAFPENLSPEPSMADEGLVPGVAGVAPYAGAGNQTAVGATR